jgi:hypothetical protein
VKVPGDLHNTTTAGWFNFRNHESIMNITLEARYSIIVDPSEMLYFYIYDEYYVGGTASLPSAYN